MCSLSVYLHNVLKNHTAHACEGDTLVIECPSRTSVTVLSAFYGRRVPNQYLCPSVNSNAAVEDTECTSALVTEVCKLKCGFCFRESFCPPSKSHIELYTFIFSHYCRKWCQNVSTDSLVTSLSSAQCLDRTPVPSLASTFWCPTSADQVGSWDPTLAVEDIHISVQCCQDALHPTIDKLNICSII